MRKVVNVIASMEWAEHFLEQGYRRFVLVGHPEDAFSREREDGFRAAAEAGGSTVCSVSAHRLSGNIPAIPAKEG